MSKFNVGDKVIFMNAKKHERLSKFYPTVGSIGIVRDKDDDSVLIDWGEVEGIHINRSHNNKKAWWCEEEDIKLCEYTDDEVWEMLKPKMNQFVRAGVDIDLYSPTVKNMVIAAYRSGYGRATKGRNFMITPRTDKKPEVKTIDDVLKGKMIVTFYKEDNSYDVSNFTYSHNTEIHVKDIYNSKGWPLVEGFDALNESGCEMYVAVPFSEVTGQFDGKSIKVLRYGRRQKSQSHIEQWAIGEYDGVRPLGNKTYAVVTFKTEYDDLTSYIGIYHPDYKALVPICDYLKHEGVNV